MTQGDTGDMLVLPDGVDIRMMRSSDMPRVRALHTQLLPNTYPTAFFVQLLVHPQQMCLIATYDGNVVAFASAAAETQNSTPGPLASCGAQERPTGTGALRATLLTLGVSPEFRRQGIARRLVHEVVQRLRSSCEAPCYEAAPAPSLRSRSDSTDAVILCAEVARNNSSGQSFYSHLGMHRQLEADRQTRFGSKAHTCVVLGVMRTVPVS
ncbi:acyl-CoA N-acyltransferase [Suillus ampliporus]|nr:acyl-CoA N-acyltransferase [Suillus ampliporus]